jgi:heme exporter protein A
MPLREGDHLAFNLSLERVGKRFGPRVVFSDVSSSVTSGQILTITGPNGSGKSTLLRIAAGLMAPSAGKVAISSSGQNLEPFERQSNIGYVAPDLILYRELTGVENLRFFARLRGIDLPRADLGALLEKVGLKGRGKDLVGAYSSGMRQRLKYAFALMHAPPILMLDEPTANLDEFGAAIVRQIVDEQRQLGLVVIATNEASEAAWGDTVVQLGP